MKKEIKLLKDYFHKLQDVILAFLFGSRAKGIFSKISDWDIGVYFKPKKDLELEVERKYPKEDKIYSDLVKILRTDNLDFVVLNRAHPELVFSILNSGKPLVIKDRKLYLELLCRTHYEAVDFREFVFEYWKISQRAKSLSREDKFQIIKRLDFLEKEWEDIEKFKKLSWQEYKEDRNKRRNLERWIENLVIVSLDIAKIILASFNESIPDSYKDTLKIFCAKYFDEKFAEEFSKFAQVRNIVVHEYLDIKWKKIKNFVKKAEKLYPPFIKKIKKILK